MRKLIEGLLLLATILTWWMAGAEFLLFGNGALPPLEGLTRYGCISLTLLDKSVRSTAWADYDDEHLEGVRKQRFSLDFQKEYPHRGWAWLVSHRYGKKADFEGAKDCVEWKRSMQQVLQPYLKEKSKEKPQ